MLKKIHIKGFKNVKEEIIEFKHINILTGVNSGGKSTILQAILLYASAFTENRILNDEVKKYSNINEIRNKYTNSKEISIKVKTHDGEGSYSQEIDEERKVDFHGEDNLRFEENLYYISANRIGQEDIAIFDKNFKFGIDGKYVFSYFEQFKDKAIQPELISVKESQTLDSQLSYWLKYILSNDMRINTEKITQSVQVNFDYNSIKGLAPSNLGAGNSYIAKILIMGLSLKPGDLILIENPEIHIHPKAQSKIADFIVFLSKAGIQSIIETHSEHLINRLRHNIYKGNLINNDISIEYKPSVKDAFIRIDLNQKGQYVDSSGQKTTFPEGFFDATLNELLEIM